MGGPRLSSYEKARRRREAENRRSARRSQLAQNARDRERKRLANKARTANERAAKKRQNAAEALRIKKDGVYNDKLARAAMEELKNIHHQDIHPYMLLNPQTVSSLAKVNIYEAFEPKPDPIFKKNKKPSKPKALTFKMPKFKKVKGEITNIEIKLKVADKERNFSVKQYLRKVKRSGFFLFWIMNKENDRYQNFIIKEHEKYRILKNDLKMLNKSLKDLKQKAKDDHAASEAKKFSIFDDILKTFNIDEATRKKQFDKDLAQFKIDEAAREKKHNNSIASKDKNRKDWLLKLKNSDKNTVLESFELMFPLNLVSEISRDRLKNEKALDSIECGYIFSKDEFKMLIRLPQSFKFLPKEWIRLTPSGKSTTTYIISDTEKRKVIKDFVASIGLAYARAILDSVEVSHALVEVSVLGDDPLTGNPKDIVLLRLNADRETYNSMNLDKVEPSKAIKNFNKTKFKPPKVDDREVTFDSEVESIIDTNNLEWCDEENDNLNMDSSTIDAILTSRDMVINKKMSKYERKIKR